MRVYRVLRHARDSRRAEFRLSADLGAAATRDGGHLVDGAARRAAHHQRGVAQGRAQGAESRAAHLGKPPRQRLRPDAPVSRALRRTVH